MERSRCGEWVMDDFGGQLSGGNQVLQDVELTAGQLATEIIHYQFTAAGALHFTLPGGDVTVRIKKF